VKLVHEWPLNNLPSIKEFTETFKDEDE